LLFFQKGLSFGFDILNMGLAYLRWDKIGGTSLLPSLDDFLVVFSDICAESFMLMSMWDE
jgi:hypothetical protein